MASRSSLVLLLCAAALLAAPAAVDAQTTGGISGTVSANDGGALPAASIEISGPASRVASTDAAGGFSLPNLPAGNYSVKISAAGFEPSTLTVAVEPGATRHLDIRLSPGSVTDAIRVRLATGVGADSTDQLVIDLDAATTIDLFNGSAVRTTFIDNTAAARRDLTYKARTNFWYVASFVDLPRVNDRVNFGFKGGLYAGSQVIAITDPSGKITEISGSGVGGTFGASALLNRSLEFSFDGSIVSINDAARAPAQTSSGRVTSDGYDIRGRRTSINVNYVRTAPKLTYKVGVSRFSTSFDLDRSLDIDFSSVQAGVGLHADGQTELNKSGFQLRAAMTYDASPRFAVTSSAAIGKKSWAIDAGVVWTIR